MQFTEEKIIKSACYSLKGSEEAYFYINSSALLAEDKQGAIKEYPIPNPSHFCFCGSSNVIAVLNTSGQLFIVDTHSDSVTKIPLQNTCEGCSPIFFNNDIYWADWNGKIFKYNLTEQKAQVIADLSEQNAMFVNLDINKSKNELTATLYSRKDGCYYLLCKHFNEEAFKTVKLPTKKRCTVLGVNYFEDKFILYESKTSSVCIFELNQNKLKTVKTIYIPDKYGVFDNNLSVLGELCALQGRSNVIVIDINKENVLFELTEKHISSVSLFKDKLYVGCWDKGISLLIQNKIKIKKG